MGGGRGMEDFFGDMGDILEFAQIFEKDDEFVAARKRGDQVGFAGTSAEPGGNLPQHLVADFVSQGIVDGLETVEIEKENGRHPPGALGFGDCPSQVAVKKHPVGQAGDLVMMGDVL